MWISSAEDRSIRRFAPPAESDEGSPATATEDPEHNRRLYEQAVADLEAARAAIRDLEDAWAASVERRLAVERALRRLLEATGSRTGYPPGLMVARARARAALHGVDPFDRPS
jgi:hypothetical protein